MAKKISDLITNNGHDSNEYNDDKEINSIIVDNLSMSVIDKSFSHAVFYILGFVEKKNITKVKMLDMSQSFKRMWRSYFNFY